MLIEHGLGHFKLFSMAIKSASRILLTSAWLLLMAAFAAGQGDPPPIQPEAPSLAEAQALLAAGKTDAAIASLKVLLKSAADEPRVNHLLGLAHYQKGDYPHAIEYLAASIKQTKEGSPQYRQAAQLLGMAHYFLGHSKEAAT